MKTGHPNIMNQANTSVLIIDDEEMVRDNIEEILVPREHYQETDSINDAVNILFDTPKPILTVRKRNAPVFTVEKAANGMEGLKKIRKAIADGHPFAVIFLECGCPGGVAWRPPLRSGNTMSRAKLYL